MDTLYVRCRLPLLWGVVMHQVQIFLCYFVFLKDETSSKTSFVPLRFKWVLVIIVFVSFLPIFYRSLYQVFIFIFFFFNSIYGVVLCFLRIFGSVIFTVVMLFRLDWDVYMRGLEGWDVGEKKRIRPLHAFIFVCIYYYLFIYLSPLCEAVTIITIIVISMLTQLYSYRV